MTNSQKKTVNMIRDYIKNDLVDRNNNEHGVYETVEWEIKEYQYFVAVVAIKTLHNRHGVIGGDYRHIFVGRKGGMTLANPGRFDETTKRIVPRKAKVTGERCLWELVSR